MSNIDEIMKEIDEIADGKDYQCAYWARSNADYLFSVIRKLSRELKSKQNQLEEAEVLLQDALWTLDNMYCDELGVYDDINKYFKKNNK